VKTVRALKKRYGDWHLAIGRHWQLKKWNQGNGGSQKKLTTTCRGMIRGATPASCKGRGHQGPGRDNVARGISKGQTFRKRRRAQLECSNIIRRQGLKERLYLGSRRTLSKTFKHIVELEIAKQRVRTSIRLPKMSVRTSWKGWPLQNERRDWTQSRNWSCRSIDHSQIFFLHWAKEEDDGVTPGHIVTLSGSLKWREQLESNESPSEPSHGGGRWD
jgi:hypothetical protein